MFPLIFHFVLLDALSSAAMFTLMAPATAFYEAYTLTVLGAK